MEKERSGTHVFTMTGSGTNDISMVYYLNSLAFVTQSNKDMSENPGTFSETVF